MAINTDFSLLRLEAGTLNVELTPPTNISGWSLLFQAKKYFGGESGLINAYAASGYNNVSGINVHNAGAGMFSVAIPAGATSGWNYGNYAFSAQRTDSGFQTVLSQGFMLVNPSIGN